MSTHISPYKDVHKGIRKLLLDLLQQAGETDFSREEEVKRFHQFHIQVHDLLELHTEVENSQLAPLIASAGAMDEMKNIESRHDHLHNLAVALQDTAKQLSQGADVARGQQFYLQLSRFVADQLQHMADEEIIIWPLLSKHCSDEQMIQVQVQARKMMPPAVMQTLFRSMIPAINFSERHHLLSAMRQSLSTEAFAGVCDLAKSVMQDNDWQEISDKLGLDSAA